jgi:LysR family glycine cleavage system transcriptional activator
MREGFDALAAAVEMIRERGAETELVITAPPVFTARWLMPRLADFAKREPKIEVRVVASSKMVDAGALDSATLINNLDLRDESSGVEIHLGLGDYRGYRADKLFEVSMVLVANPDLVTKENIVRTPEDLKNHVLLHDDAMDLVAGGDAWRKWLEAAHVADRIDGSRGPRFSSNILSLEAASQKLGLALALKPLVDADVASGRLCLPLDIAVKPLGSYWLVCPEVIAERPAVNAFRRWLLKQV